MTYQKTLQDHGLLMHIQWNLSTMGTQESGRCYGEVGV